VVEAINPPGGARGRCAVAPRFEIGS
jgi:hypothetical protein